MPPIMILLADPLAADSGPGLPWSLIASTGALLALLAAAFWQGREIAALREAVKRLQEPPPPPVVPARSSKPMFAGLYAEPAPGPLEGLNRIPGGPGFVAAGVLALLALVLALTTTGSGAATSGNQVALDSVRSRVDSVAGVVRLLGDSLRLVTTAATKPVPAASTPSPVQRVATRRNSTAPVPSQILPPPPLPGAP